MLWRLVYFLCFQLCGALLGAGVADYVFAAKSTLPGAMVGMVLASAIWMLTDSLRGEQVLKWLRSGDIDGSAVRFGYWGDIVGRARRLVRAHEEQTESADARLQAFLAAIQASPSGVMLLDRRNRIEWCNVTAADQFGLDAKRDLAQVVLNLIRAPEFINYMAREDFSRDVVIQMPMRGMSPGRAISLQIHPYGEGSKLLLSRDVTEFKRIEAMRRDFVANVSHEIRTPLTVLAGFVETMQTLPLDDADRARYLGLMAQQSSRMQSLVSDLLTLSQLESAPAPGAAEWVAMSPLLTQAEAEARVLSSIVAGRGGKADNAAHNFEFRVMPDIEIAGAQSELQSAIANLIGNAVRYSELGGAITVSLSLSSQGTAIFNVKDAGPGIAPEHLARLTERFYRVDRSRSRDTGGTGLGLAIVKHVVQRHGGELEIASILGQGASFSMTFPTHRVRTTSHRESEK